MLLTLLLALQSPTVSVGGRLMSDFHFADGGAATEAVVGMPLEEGAGIRRARIRVFGDLGRDLSFLTEFEFASSSDLKELSLRYARGDMRWRAGYFRQPFGMDNSTSSNFHDLMEEPPMSRALGTARAAGLGWRRSVEASTLQAGIYRSLDPKVGASPDEAWSLNTRAVWRPWVRGGQSGQEAEPTEILHLGAAVNLAFPDDPIAFAAGPGLHGFPDLVATGPLDASRTLRLALEAAWIQGPWHGTAEWMRATPEIADGGDVDLQGWSVSSGLFLTGQSRGYSLQRATFGRFPGEAWEVVGQLGNLDLSGAGGPAQELDTLALGLTYHWSDHTRMLLQWTRAEVATLDSSDFLSLRFAFDF